MSPLEKMLEALAAAIEAGGVSIEKIDPAIAARVVQLHKAGWDGEHLCHFIGVSSASREVHKLWKTLRHLLEGHDSVEAGALMLAIMDFEDVAAGVLVRAGEAVSDPFPIAGFHADQAANRTAIAAAITKAKENREAKAKATQ